MINLYPADVNHFDTETDAFNRYIRSKNNRQNIDTAERRNNGGFSAGKQLSSVLLLLVDDDPVNIRVLKQLLESEYEIVSSLDPLEVLENEHLHRFDLIITDVMMPKMSGYQLTQEIRKKFHLFEIPILHVTARSTSEDIQISFKSGANDYLVKPIHALELRVRVRALTNLKHYIRESQKFEAAWLQAKIQPHFLFNTLNTIASLAEVDQDRMIDTLHAFGTY